MESFHHRPGPLKQQNKGHSHGKHKSKRQVKNSRKFRRNQSVNGTKFNFHKKTPKPQRINTAKQIRAAKIESAKQERLKVGSPSSPPLFVAILCLDDEADSRLLLSQIGASPLGSNHRSYHVGFHHLWVQQQKCHLSFFAVNRGDFHSTVDLLLTADVIIGLQTYDKSPDSASHEILSTMSIHKYSSFIPVIQCTHPGPLTHSEVSFARKVYQKQLSPCLSSFEKTKFVKSPPDIDNLLVNITSVNRRPNPLLVDRPHFQVEEFTFMRDQKSLEVSGFLRGCPLVVNSWIHIPQVGEYKIAKLKYSKSSVGDNRKNVEMDREVTMERGESEGEDNFEDVDMMSESDVAYSEERPPSDVIPITDISDCEGLSDSNATLDAEDDRQFPDQVDPSSSARVRFRKYRGLESFRTSAWDESFDEFPDEFPGLIQLKNPRATRKHVSSKLEENPNKAPVGSYVTILLEEAQPITLNAGSAMAAYGLFPYERSLTMMNIKLTATSSMEAAIKAKKQLLFQVGFRRFCAAPIFSEHFIACDKFKFVRWFQPSDVVVASLYAPLLFDGGVVSVFDGGEGGGLNLVAEGSVISCDCSRLVIKRVVLNGSTTVVRGKNAVAREMFANPEDVNYFKSVEIYTSSNKRGRIVDSLGTHGRMKCTFGSVLKTQESIFMSLYKRVFPRLTYRPVYTEDDYLEAIRL